MESTEDRYCNFMIAKGLNKSTMDIRLFEATIEFIETSGPVNVDLGDVSQQRELLIAFLEWEHASSIDLSDENHIIDNYFKAINGG